MVRPTGIVRRIDELGRIVVPKELRRTLRIREGDSVEIYVDENANIVLKKYSPVGQLKTMSRDMAEALAESSGLVALVCDKDLVLASAGAGAPDLTDRSIGGAVEKSMNERQVLLVHFSGGGESSSIVDKSADGFVIVSAAIAPIVVEGEAVGAVVVGTTSNKSTVGDLEESLVVAAAGYFSRQVG